MCFRIRLRLGLVPYLPSVKPLWIANSLRKSGGEFVTKALLLGAIKGCYNNKGEDHISNF